MAREEADPRRLQCPSCGTFLQPGLADQFFCEYCGSPLPDSRQDVSVYEVQNSSEIPSSEAVEPDQIGEIDEQASPEREDAPRRIELHPTRPPRPPSEVPVRRGSTIYAIVVAMVLVLVFFGLLGWLLFSVLGA